MKQQYLILGGIVAASAAVLLLRKKDSESEFVAEIPATTTPVTNTPTPVAVILNNNLTLKKGSKGNEVRELQKLLGVTVDGDFGTNTEAALIAKKNVKQITLNQYATTASVNSSALAVGTRVMANVRTGVKVNEALTKADGSMYDSGVVYDTIDYGIEIGTIISVSTSKNYYVVATPTWYFGTAKVWVSASQVAKI